MAALTETQQALLRFLYDADALGLTCWLIPDEQGNPESRLIATTEDDYRLIRNSLGEVVRYAGTCWRQINANTADVAALDA